MTTKSLVDDETPAKHLPDEPHWCENYAWCGYDPKSGIGHFFSMGRWLRDLEMWRCVLLVSLPDGRVLTSKSHGRGTDVSASTGDLTFTVVEPKKKFQLTFESGVASFEAEELRTRGYYIKPTEKLKFEFNFESDDPLLDLSAGGDINDFTGKGHTEQHGLASGVMECGGERFELQPSYVNRDHSRGACDLTAYKRHCWMNGAFPSGTKFWCYYVEVQGIDGPAMAEAAVSRDGKIYHGEVVKMVEDRGNDCDAMQPFTIVIKSELGEMEITGKPINLMPFSASVTPYDGYPGWSPDYDFDNLLVLEQSMV